MCPGELRLELHRNWWTGLMSPAAEVRSRIHSLRCWVLRRRALLHSLTASFPGEMQGQITPWLAG